MRGSILVERVVQDLRFAFRMLRRSPGFTAVALCTLALGVGATTALFTVVNGVMLRPLPFPDPARLVMVWEQAPGSTRPNVVQTQNFLDWHARNRSFDGIAAVHQLPMTVSGTGEAEEVPVLRVTGDFFRVLGVAPLLGRAIRPGEDVSGSAPTAVLSYAYWQRRLNGDPEVVGRTINVLGTPHQIVGVMPAGFAFPGARAELFVSLLIDRNMAPKEGRNYWTVARLRPGVTLERSQADISTIVAQIVQERPDNRKWGAIVIPLHEQTVGDVRLALTVLFAAVVCVLLIACVNIANLLSMRSAARAREITVRLALGAGRGRIVQQLLVESLFLASLGGLLGFALAYAGVPAVIAMLPASFPLPRVEEIGVDVRVFLFTLAVSMAAGLLFGLVPALQARRRDLAHAIHGSSRSVTGSGARVRAGLVVGEVTLAVVLVIGAGLMVRSLLQLARVDPGFKSEHVLTVRMFLLLSKYADVPRRAAIMDRMLERLRATPQVTAASSIHMLPMTGLNSGTGYHRLDRPRPEPGSAVGGGGVSVVSTGYFRTMGIPLLAGRDFTASDTLDTPRVVVVNQTVAQRFFPGESPIGKRLAVQWNTRLRPGTPEFEIVGVVADIRHGGLSSAPQPCIFLSHAQEPNLRASLVLRTSGDPMAVAAAVRKQLHEIDPDQGVSSIEAMSAVVSESVARPRLQTLLLGAFGALALLMACVGLYGVLAYSVEQRRREMGVRLALGAAPAAILRLVVGEGLRLTLVGLVTGLLAALVVTRYLATLLYDVKPHDAAVFVSVGLTLLLVAAAACWLPARRAMRVDPALILRDE